MNILDENIPRHQRQILRSQRIRVRQIGYDVGRKGMKDDEIIPWLLVQRNPTFFTRDLGFASASYAMPTIVWFVWLLDGMKPPLSYVACYGIPSSTRKETNGYSDSCFSCKA